MDAYIYQAALLCAGHGEETRARIRAEGNAPEDESNESSYDSDEYPKGPLPDGGGEADTPQHCDVCQRFLENPLTSDGYAYVADSIAEALTRLLAGKDKQLSDTIREWAVFYDAVVGVEVGGQTATVEIE